MYVTLITRYSVRIQSTFPPYDNHTLYGVYFTEYTISNHVGWCKGSSCKALLYSPCTDTVCVCTCTVCTRRVHITSTYIRIHGYPLQVSCNSRIFIYGEPFIFSHPSSAAWVSCLLLALPFPTLFLLMISFAFKEHCHRFGHETLRPP